MTIRILIADDHSVVAEGLSKLIEQHNDMEIVALVEDGHEAIRHTLEKSPDVVIMDLAMPVMNGNDATRIIRQKSPGSRVIILSAYSDPVHVSRALQAGAAGYISKKSVAMDLIDAIRKVHEGSRYISSNLTDELIEHIFKDDTYDPLQGISSRERQVLQLLAEGNSVTRIAESLSLSPKTVETYRYRIMQKLKVKDIASLVKFAIQQGMTPLD